MIGIYYSTSAISPEILEQMQEASGQRFINMREFDYHHAQAQDIEILLCQSGPPTAAQLAKLPFVKWIQCFNAGVNDFPLADIQKRGILLTNTAGAHAPQVSEHAFAMMLAFSRGLVYNIRHQQQRRWNFTFGGSPLADQEAVLKEADDVLGKELLIVGSGRIGRMLAKRAKAFDMRVVGIRSQEGGALEHFDALHGMGALKEVLQTADYVVSILPETPQTKGVFAKEQFEKMKSSAVFINVGRGSAVVEKDLIEVLQQGRIKGAGLDVFETEPLPEESPLYDLENVILMPHNAGQSRQNAPRCAAVYMENYRRYRAGQPLTHRVDPQKGY